MTPSQAAQEKLTSPRRVIDVLEDHTFDASRGGRCSCGQWPASGERYHTEHVAAAIEREAAAATPSLDGSDSLTFLALSQHLDHHTPMAAVRTFPRIDCRCGWEGFDWPVHFYGSNLARLDEGSATPDQGKGEPR